MDEEKQPGSYSKKSVWYWVVLYVVIGAIVYGLVYYLLTRTGGGSTYPY